jgi:hypothetical protein
MMIYVKVENGIPVKISDIYSDEIRESRSGWQNRSDWNSLEQVQSLARYITAMTGDVYIGTDAGDHVSPRYDIVKLPKIGDKVSYGFNGDCYPDGEIVKISKNFQITTSSGRKYRRQGDSARWITVGGTWSLVAGHKSSRNPQF